MKITPLPSVGSTLSLFGQCSVRMLGTMIGILLVVTALSLTAQPSLTSAGGLVGHWNFDDGSGLFAADSSGFGNHGRLLDGPIWWQNLDRPPFVLLFDGVNDHVNVGNSPSLNPPDEITLAAWVTPFSLNVSGEIIAKSNGTNPQYYLRMQAGGKIRFGIGGTVLNGNTTLSPSASTLHHVAGTYDGSTMKIYVDGVLDAAMSNNGPMHDNGVDVWIGCRHFQSPLAFGGLIDDPRIYNRALDATEIQSLVTPGTVVITSPATDQTFLPGDGVTITADVFNFSAPVTKVDFYEGSTLIGTATQAPYSVVYYNPFIDNSRHYIVAVATDTAGNTVSSVPGAFWFEFCDDTFTRADLALSNSVFPVPYGDPIFIRLDLYDPCGTLAGEVDLYDNGVLLAHFDTLGDFTAGAFVWANAQPGDHEITATIVLSQDKGVYYLFPIGVTVTVPANQPPPANDDFANSFDLAQITTGNNANATREPGEPSTLGAGHSVWWHYAAPSDGLVVFSTVGSSFDTGVAIYTGNTLDNLSLLGWNYDFNDPQPAILWFNLIAGTTYQISVDDLGGAWGDIQLNVHYDVAPTFDITSPTDGAVFTAPADVPVHVTAQDPDGSVARIELSLVRLTDGTTTTFTSSAADVDYTFPSLAVGNYQLIVRVTDNLGIMIPNSVVFTVQ